MNANELRIGNLIQWESTGDIDSVINIRTSGLQYHTINDINIKDCKPIILNEEWLLKFGFNKVHESKTWEEVKISDIDGEYMYWISGMYYLTQNGNWWSLYHSTDEDTYWLIHHNVQYVHQLQNLYFALTNTELEVK